MSSAARSDTTVRRTILLVDDDARLLKIMALQLRLSDEWLLVGSVGDPTDALALATTTHPEIVLLDLWLHGDDSLSLLGQLCALDPAPRVVMLTAEADPRWRDQALEAGATAYLSKLDLVDLPAALRNL